MFIDDIQWFRFTLGLQPPAHYAGATLTQRQGYLLRLMTNTGLVAWGEASPFPDTGTKQDNTHSRARLSFLLRGKGIDVLPFGLLRQYPLPSDIPRAFLFAAEQALDRIRAAESGKPLRQFLNPAAPDQLPLCALLDGSPADARHLADQAATRGMTAVKIKVGRGAVEDEIDLARDLRRRLPLPCRIRLDANRAWEWDAALKFSAAVRDLALDYLEEPLADPSQLPRFTLCTGIPYAVDETLADHWAATQQAGKGTVAAWRCAALDQAAYAVWKPTVVPLPESMNLAGVPPTVLSGAYESGVGTAAILALSAALGGNTLPPGVDTYCRLTQDVLRSRLDLSAPFVMVSAAEQRAAEINAALLEPLPDAG